MTGQSCAKGTAELMHTRTAGGAKKLPLIVIALLMFVAVLWIGGNRHVQGLDHASETYIRAAHWFGGSWPVGFWNTDLRARAESDFALLRDDGFNTVVFLVPWAGFAPDPLSGELDDQRVQLLRDLMDLAQDMNLQVILRVSYGWDSLEQGEDGARMAAVWLSEAYRQGWLQYLESLWDAVGDHPALMFGFFSWEDLWAVMNFPGATLAQRLAGASDSGFRDWLKERAELDEVSERFRVDFERWEEVPIPTRREPAFRYFLKFINQAWIERFFVPAQTRFPSLSMEVRIDSDPVWDGETLLEWFSHEAAWDLPGAEWVTLYWAPSMGGENRGEILEPEEAARRLQWWLQRVAGGAGSRKIFIGQFLAEDFTPGYEQNGRLARDEVGRFLELAAPVLRDHAAGVGLWTWTDYGHDQIRNPDFSAGLKGWRHHQDVFNDDGVLRLGNGHWLIAELQSAHHADGGPSVSRLCVRGRATNEAGALLVSPGPDRIEQPGRLNFGESESVECLEYPVRGIQELRLDVDGGLSIDSATSISFVQKSGMRDLDFQPKAVARYYRALNHSLGSSQAAEQPRYEDGWMGRQLRKRMDADAEGAGRLHLQTYLPPDWPVSPELRVSIDGRYVGTVACRVEGDYKFELSDEPAANVMLAIEASQTHQPPGDARRLGCHITSLRLID